MSKSIYWRRGGRAIVLLRKRTFDRIPGIVHAAKRKKEELAAPNMKWEGERLYFASLTSNIIVSGKEGRREERGRPFRPRIRGKGGV